MKKLCILIALCMLLSGCDVTLMGSRDEEIPWETFGTKPVREDPGQALLYQKAMSCLSDRDYETAWDLFLELGDYRDAAEYAARFLVVENVLLHAVEQSSAPEAAPVTVSYSYNSDGLLVGQETLSQGVVMESLSYLEDGRLAIRETPQGSYHLMFDGDLNLSGSIEQIINDSGGDTLISRSFRLDEAGRIVSENGNVHRTSGGKGISEAQFKGTYTYDEEGRLLCYEREYTQGPARDYREDYTYDSRGLLVEKHTQDVWEDYTDTTREFWGYDEQGSLAMEEYQYIRVFSDGRKEVLSQSQTYYFLENGLRTGGLRVEGDVTTNISYVYGDSVFYIPPETEGGETP